MKKCSFCGESIPDETVVCRWYGRKQTQISTKPDEKKADKLKRLFCYRCGTQLPDQANYCWKCGNPRKEGTQAKSPEWETCTITYEAVRNNKFLGSHSGQARWWAKATRPRESYRAGESPIFYASVEKGVVEIPYSNPGFSAHLTYIDTLKVLDVLTNKLIADGWEPTGTYGASYWKRQYRRRIR
jgi:ribosomal protein L40E